MAIRQVVINVPVSVLVAEETDEAAFAQAVDNFVISGMWISGDIRQLTLRLADE